MAEFYVSVSPDGVVELPAALLPHFAGSAVVCFGKDSSLLLCTQLQWDDFLTRLRESSAKSQAASRVFVTTAVQVDLRRLPDAAAASTPLSWQNTANWCPISKKMPPPSTPVPWV